LIDLVDDGLVKWAQKTLGNSQGPGSIEISLGSPEKTCSGQGVNLYLLALAENPPLQGARRAPLQFWLRYLVTTWAQTPEKAHAILGELLMAALDTPEFEIEIDSIPPAIWAGFGVPPRPAFIIRVPVRRDRAQHLAPLVREPLNVKWVKSIQLTGLVYGPEDSPLAGARIALMPDAGDRPPALEYARLCPTMLTNEQGMFSFHSVPVQSRYSVFIHIKDQELFISFDRPAQESTPLVLRWGLLALQVMDAEGQPAAGALLRFSRDSGTANEIGLLLEDGQGPMRSLRLEYPALQLSTPLNTQGQGYLLLHEKAISQAGQWITKLYGQVLTVDRRPLGRASINCPSLHLSATADEQGVFILK
jgi:hypothetical protein